MVKPALPKNASAKTSKSGKSKKSGKPKNRSKPTSHHDTQSRKFAKLAKKATFVGIDLAWSERNPSGCAVIRNSRLVAYSGLLGSNQEILAFIRTHLADECPAVIGIDAPLRVPNETGSRLCDRALSAEWRRFDAGALPANRRLFARMNPNRVNLGAENPTRVVSSPESDNEEGPLKAEGDIENPVRGEVLVSLLTDRLRVSESAQIPQRTDDRIICEIYPHPAHVSLFGLGKTLKYKSRSKRSYEDRWPEFERYQQYLRSLRNAEPELKRTKALLAKTDVRKMRGKALKQYEDTLDAITCAYVAYYLWYHGPNFARTYGTLADGHIIVPLTEYALAQLGDG